MGSFQWRWVSGISGTSGQLHEAQRCRGAWGRRACLEREARACPVVSRCRWASCPSVASFAPLSCLCVHRIFRLLRPLPSFLSVFSSPCLSPPRILLLWTHWARKHLLGDGPCAYVLIKQALGWVKALVNIGLAKMLVWVFLYALTERVDFLSNPVVWMLPGKAWCVFPQLFLICFTPFSSFLRHLKNLPEAFGYVISVSLGGFDTDFCFRLSMTILKFHKCFKAWLN